MTSPDPRPAVQIDIVSDVVCPWCIVGFLQLDQALTREGVQARLRWHPFELNPAMGPEGQNLRLWASGPEQGMVRERNLGL